MHTPVHTPARASAHTPAAAPPSAQVELLLKRRGDYRPHQDFGINLSIPWSAGGCEDPSFHVNAGSAYTTTQGLEDKRSAHALTYT